MESTISKKNVNKFNLGRYEVLAKLKIEQDYSNFID